MKTKFSIWLLCACCLIFGAACSGNAQKQKGDESKPEAPETVFTKFVQQQYPNATIDEIQPQVNGTLVEIKDDGIEKDLFFDNAKQWVSTSWDIKPEDVPVSIMGELENSAYALWGMKETTIIERPDGIFYLFELSKDNNTVQVLYNQDGEHVAEVTVE